MSWRGVLTLVLLVAAAVTGWAVWRQRAPEPAAAAAVARPDYVLHDFELVALDKQGKEAFVLRAPELSRSPDDKTLSIATPLFLIPDKEGKRWEVRSKTGWVAADNSEIRLRGKVEATSPPGDSRPSTMKTEQLNVFPDANKAASAVLVTVTGPTSTMQGTGMRADLATNRIQLLSKVSLSHDPTHR
ncbi:LPS export ABC transporter periplasmic protein LptC [Luteimonas mephitis]|jgi:lipopolysaccharide export system protein LptC|uniref:LPS export ABC transporter periplasmic protein LptC n=1 Tax=Luteimonas mephitis TaxID=83615 RepID=UPI00040594EA|nr:LPS export ABC transporter periplasmic protein LptC [Luteimonas mephitis]